MTNKITMCFGLGLTENQAEINSEMALKIARFMVDDGEDVEIRIRTDDGCKVLKFLESLEQKKG